VANWLLSIGVDPKRLYLHIAPPSRQAAVPPTGLTIKPAARDEIWSSIDDISKQRGDRLYVFLSGHGYYLAATGPIFLTQDWSKKFLDKNLDILSFAGFFRSLSFTDQLFVVDACQNYATDPIYRSPIPPSGPSIQNWTPQPANGLILCTAASQGQYAVVSQGRGLLIRNLLGAVKELMADKVPLVAGDAIEYNWQTGARRLDLKPLFDFVVKPVVIAAAGNANQTPTIQPHGRFTSESAWIILDLVPLPTVPLSITPVPESSVETIRVELRPPTSALRLPLPGTPSTFRYLGVAPRGSRLIVNCTAVAGWVAKPPMDDVTNVPDAGLRLEFALSPSPSGPELNQINLRLVNREGAGRAGLLTSDYAEAGAATAAPQGTPYTVHHESGPDIF
jgi:hypothetical protein